MTHDQIVVVMIQVASLARTVADLQRAVAYEDHSYIVGDLANIDRQRRDIVNTLQAFAPTLSISA